MTKEREALELAHELEPFVHGLGKAILRELKGALAQPDATLISEGTMPEQGPAPKGKRFQTKFNIEDRVWYMKNNRPVEVVISTIEIFFVNTNQDRITYNAKDMVNSISWLDHTKLQEDWLFKSKAELLGAL